MNSCVLDIQKIVSLENPNIARDTKIATGIQWLSDLTVFLACLGGASITETITHLLVRIGEDYNPGIYLAY